MKLSNEELKKVSGGDSTVFIISAALAAIAYITGIIDGFFRPHVCRWKEIIWK